MARVHWAILTVLAIPMGCQGPGYSPYGYSSPYGYPAGGGGYGQPYMQPYGQPIQTMTPGPSYVPNGGSMQPVPDGGATFRSNTIPGPSGGLTPVPEPGGGAAPLGGGAPPYNPPPNGGLGPGPMSPMVPIPRDSVQFQQPILREPPGGTIPLGPGPGSPFAEVQPAGAGSNPCAARERPPAVAADPLFEPAPAEGTVPGRALKPIIPSADGTTPFAYDSQNYKWLRGVVSYEKTDRHWSLVYSDAPDDADELSGCVTIGDQPELMGIGDGEIILVTGEFSGTDTDPRGKPIYVVKEITRHGKASLVSER